MEQEPRDKLIGKLPWHERFDIVYWRSVCHFDVALSHRENRGSTTVMQNRDTNLESRYDCHSRTGVGPEGRKHEEASPRETGGFEKSYRVESMFPPGATIPSSTAFFPFFFFLLSHTRQQLRYLSGPLNFHLSFKLNRQQRKIINQLKFQKNHGCYFSLEQSLSHFIR